MLSLQFHGDSKVKMADLQAHRATPDGDADLRISEKPSLELVLSQVSVVMPSDKGVGDSPFAPGRPTPAAYIAPDVPR
jgi:hypothetical protein